MEDTAKTLELIKSAQTQPVDDAIQKSWTQGTITSGLTYYDLEAPAKLIFPVITPLRNRIPRDASGAGTAINWRAITGINTSQMMAGVAAGKRSGVIAHTTADYTAAFKGIGLEDSVDFEAEYSAKNFDDPKARAVDGLLRSTMIREEFLDLGGNNSLALGTASTPSLADIATTGTLAANTQYDVRVVGLTLQGYQQVAGVCNGTVNDSVAIASLAIVRTVTRINADATTDTINAGCGQVSALANVTTANDGNATHAVSASVTPKAGEVAWVWFWGAHTGDILLGAVTTINSVKITATATGTQNVTDFTTNAADNSRDSLVYDGLFSQIYTSASGSYIAALANGTAGTGTALTSDGAGGITEIGTAFAAFWDNYRISPQVIYVSGSLLKNMNALTIANGSAPLIRYTMDGGGGQQITAGTVIGSILNPTTNQAVKIEVHPNMPKGMMMFYSETIPYPLSGIGALLKKKLRRDYYQIEWPLKTRKYEYGVYFDGVLQNYFPPAFGIIRNIAH